MIQVNDRDERPADKDAIRAGRRPFCALRQSFWRSASCRSAARRPPMRMRRTTATRPRTSRGAIAGCSILIRDGSLTPKRRAQAYSRRAIAYRTRGEFDRAIADHDAAIRLDPDSAWLRFDRGNTHHAKRDYERAIADFSDAIRRDPRNSSFHNSRGLSHFAAGDYRSAIADFDQAIRIDPTSGSARNNLGNVLRASGDLDRAVAVYDEAIRLDPKYAPPYSNRALAFADKNEFDRAIADYTAAIRLDPGRTIFYRNRGAAYHTIGDTARAIADYDAAIRLDPTDVRSYAARGYFQLSRGAADRADVDANEAIRRDPGQPAGFEARAFVAFWRGISPGRRSTSSARSKLRPEPRDEPYVVLLRFLAASRSGEAAHAELAAHAGRLAGKQLRERQWPYPVIELHLGRRALDTVLAGARTRGERCEGRFYIAQWHVLRGEKAAAADALRVAAEICPARITEHALVAPELERLGAPAATPAAAAPGPAPATPSAPTQAARRIEATTDNEFRELLKAEPGTIVLLLTSFDPNCRPCIDANRAFEVARRPACRTRSVRQDPLRAVEQHSGDLGARGAQPPGPARHPAVPRRTGAAPRDGASTGAGAGKAPVRRRRGASQGLRTGPGAAGDTAAARTRPAPPGDQRVPRLLPRPGQSLGQGGTRSRRRALGRFRDDPRPLRRLLPQPGLRLCGDPVQRRLLLREQPRRSGRADNCNMPCGGDAQQICGGAWANSVWRVGGRRRRAPSVTVGPSARRGNGS
ncbi:MAG: tetratricopeptide repeat protein [Xanthobacteraceae bacterium]|nr:tetratricopeptide repeat protein [Xanthobacteraceae bacterium]